MKGVYALENATIPMYPTIDTRLATTSAKTADYTVTVADLATPKLFTNTGASGTVVFTLPSVASAKGKVMKVHLFAAQVVRLLPVTGEAINLNTSAVVTKYLNVAGVIGNFVEVFSDGSQWIFTRGSGVITKEA